MTLDLRSLRHLVVLSRRLHFTRAADDLGISQSALSRSIQMLERRVGMRLFDRERGGVAPTARGLLLAQRAAAVIADVDDIERQLFLDTQGDIGRVRFGIAPMPARALLSGVLSRRLEHAPKASHDVVVRDVTALWDLLLAGEIEFFVAQDGLIPNPSQARIDLVGRFPLDLVVRPGHPLLSGDIAGKRFAVLRSSWAGLPLPASILDHVHGTPSVIEDYATLADMTATSDAIWFASSYAIADDLLAGRLRELPMPPQAKPANIRVVMHTLARRSLSPQIRALRQAFRQETRRLSEAVSGR